MVSRLLSDYYQLYKDIWSTQSGDEIWIGALKSFVYLFKVAQVKYNPNFSHNVQKTNSFIIIYRSHDKSKKNDFGGNGPDSFI